ncbi:MAG: DUF4330 family protein [Coriobacteriia bacterium]
MKLLDEKKRLFGVINPVDLVAILVVVALVAALANVLFGASVGTNVVSAEGEDTIELVATGLLSEITEIQYEIGQEVGRAGGLGVMGTLVSLEITPYEREVYDAEGDPLMVVSPTTQRVTVVVRGTGNLTDSTATMGSEKIRQNMTVDLQLPHFQLPVRVLSITKVDE